MSVFDAIVTKNDETRGSKIVIHGTGGVGKTTLAVNIAKQRNGVFLLAEDGIGNNPDAEGVARIPISCWSHIGTPNGVSIKDAIKDLLTVEHKFKAVVIDTLDALVPSMDQYVVATVYGGDTKKADAYKQKYQDYVREVSFILSGLEMLVKKGIDVIVLVHSEIQNHKDPVNEAWKRWELSMPGGEKTNTAAKLYDWADHVLFATYDVSVSADKKAKGGQRVLLSSDNPAFSSKSRPAKGGSLPEKLKLDYAELAKYIWPDDKKVGKK